MQGKYRPRESSLDARPIRVPPVPVIKLQAINIGKHESMRSPTFGTFSTLTSYSRPPRGPVKGTRSSTQRRGRIPRTDAEVFHNQDNFMYEEYRKAEIFQARRLPCARSPCWYIDKVQDESELLTKGPVPEQSTARNGLIKWVAVRLRQDMEEVLRARRGPSQPKLNLFL